MGAHTAGIRVPRNRGTSRKYIMKAHTEYCFMDCKREVNHPDTLHNDGRCEACHEAFRKVAVS